MKISCVSDTVTVIELSFEEMKKYDFNIEKSDYSSPHTRKVLWSIIDEASKLTGRNVEVNQGLESLDEGLMELALLRLANPEASLEELRKLSTQPLTKSGINHRFARLLKISEEITKNKYINSCLYAISLDTQQHSQRNPFMMHWVAIATFQKPKITTSFCAQC